MKNNKSKFLIISIIQFMLFPTIILLLNFFKIIEIDSYYDLLLISSFFLILFGSNRYENWRKLNNNPRLYNLEYLEKLSANEKFKDNFYFLKWKKVVNILLLLLCFYVLIKLDIKVELVIFAVLILIIYFSFLEIKDLLYFKPVIKISEKTIWLKNFGLISKDEIEKTNLRTRVSRHIPFNTLYYLDIYLKTSKYNSPDVSIYLNSLKNRKKLIDILNLKA